MWNYFKGLLHNPLFKKLSAVFIAASIIMGIVYSEGGATADEIISVWLLAFGLVAAQLILDYKEDKRPIFPYWGDKFDVQECIALLSSEKFKPRLNQSGNPIENFEVSESGRWFCIKGQYFPTYLVYDYDPSTRELTMIDGAQVYIGDWTDDPGIDIALRRFLKGDRTLKIDDDYHVEIYANDCAMAFESCFNGNYSDLITADWDQIRYLWEKELSELVVNDLSKMDYRYHTRALNENSFAGDAILTRVLTNEEILVIADAVRTGRLNGIKEWFQLDSYKDDICACNGVKLLKALGYPKNKPGTRFLFDCLKDIQKPYFEEAVSVLEEFPYEELTEIIEQYVEKAHTEGDVLFGAGLIYLSKRIGYEISLTKPSEDTLSELEQEQIPRSQTMTWL